MRGIQKIANDTSIALKIASIYAAIALCWIMFSDKFVLFLVHDPHILTTLQNIKGSFFVIFTAALLYLLFKNEIRKKLVIENLLRKNEERLNETQKIVRLGSWEFDVANNTLWWSKETYRIFGFAAGDRTAFATFINAVHREDRPLVAESIRDSLEHGTPLKLDYRIELPGGEIRYLHEESVAVYDEAGSAIVKRAGSVQDVTEQKRLELDREEIIRKLEKSLDEIKTLRGILPLCSYCKKIRDEDGHWEQVDTYIYKHSQADISHGVCPDCLKKHYPEYSEKG